LINVVAIVVNQVAPILRDNEERDGVIIFHFNYKYDREVKAEVDQ